MIEIETTPSEPVRETTDRALGLAVRRGLMCTCPACGKGKLFAKYLKVADTCPSCNEELHHHRADDAPPYFTMLITGHIIIAGLLALEQAYAPPTWVQLAIWAPMLVILSLVLLPSVKGALVGLQWALRMHGFGGSEPEAEDASHG